LADIIIYVHDIEQRISIASFDLKDVIILAFMAQLSKTTGVHVSGPIDITCMTNSITFLRWQHQLTCCPNQHFTYYAMNAYIVACNLNYLIENRLFLENPSF
jgi:hypothetical protein